MELERNVGGFDRLARVVLGVALLAVALGSVRSGRLIIAAVAVLTGAGLLFNAAAQFCGVNALLGRNTCDEK